MPSESEMFKRNPVSYSIWLMPDSKVKDQLKNKILALGSDFGGPIFEPHVTLIGSSLGAENTLLQKTEIIRLNITTILKNISLNLLIPRPIVSPSILCVVVLFPEEIETDCVLGFFGLIMKLGPIAEWGLNLEKKHIPVNTENFQTNKEGIFAIGDICTYPGKLKLILSGFHEGALAARACFKLAKPNEKYRFEFTTTSKSMHERLGVKIK